MVKRIGVLLVTTTILLLSVAATNALAATSAAVGPATSAAVHRAAASNADQVVSAPGRGTSHATLTAYGWDGDRWVAEIGPVAADVRGRSRSGHTIRLSASDDHWVDDPTSVAHNTWPTGPAGGRWKSAETLSGYEYAVAFDFNEQPVVADGNSVIFLHDGWRRDARLRRGRPPDARSDHASARPPHLPEDRARPRREGVPEDLAPPNAGGGLTAQSNDVTLDVAVAATLRRWFADHPSGAGSPRSTERTARRVQAVRPSWRPIQSGASATHWRQNVKS